MSSGPWSTRLADRFPLSTGPLLRADVHAELVGLTPKALRISDALSIEVVYGDVNSLTWSGTVECS